MAVFVALTIAVSARPALGLDSRAFQIANDLRAPWLDAGPRLVTKLGLIAIVGSAVLLGAAMYALAAIGAGVWQARRETAIGGQPTASAPTAAT